MLNRLHTLCLLAALSALSLLASVAQAQTYPDFSPVVEQAAPAVVNISAIHTAEQAMKRGQNAQDAQMEEFLRRFFGQQGVPPQASRDRTSLGTGFIVSADGYVLTNHHVIDGADEVFVRLADRRELEAEVIGSDEQSDVAVLKVKGSNLPTVPLGDSSQLKPGQWVIAIGSPFGFEQSVTAGIVSATGRTSRMTRQQYVPFIQTDVAINRGNSGGPLLNTQGQVIGINSQIFSNTGGFMGVSFAIPVETAMRSVNQLKSKGYVSRGLLGVNIQEVTRDQAKAMGMARPYGALVSGFGKDSAGEKGGIKIGDVITHFNGKEVVRSGALPPMVGATQPGSKAAVTVLRDGASKSLTVTVGELPREGGALARASGSKKQGQSNVLGLVVRDLAQKEREVLGVEDGKGVLIAEVTSVSARRARLQHGDVILRVGNESVRDVASFNKALKALPKDRPVMLLVQREGMTQFLTVEPTPSK